jgi:hypothetical protein
MIENMAYEAKREALAHAVGLAKNLAAERRMKGDPPATAEQIVVDAKTFHEFFESQ